MSNPSETDLESYVKQLEKRIEQLEEEKQEPSSDTVSQQNVSRRKFLKTVAGGAAGLSALSLLPAASAFSLRSPTDFSFFGNSGSSADFIVNANGNLDLSGSSILNADSMTSNTINTAELNGNLTNNRSVTHIGGNIFVQDTEPSNPKNGDIWIDTSQ